MSEHISPESTMEYLLVPPPGEKWEDRRVKLKFDVCPSATCRCNNVTIKVFDTKSSSENAPLLGEILIDVFENNVINSSPRINKPLPAEEARDILALFEKKDWKFLNDLYFSEKRRVTENIDIKDTQAIFPMREIENSAEMVSYFEILPYGENLIVNQDGVHYLLDDQYCIRPECRCSRTAITFVPIKDGVAQTSRHHFIEMDYKKGSWESIYNGSSTPKQPNELLAMFRQKYPNLSLILGRRKKALTDLYSDYRKTRRDLSTPKLVSSNKVGRNESCPCGSGKKYKKCCESLTPRTSEL